MIKIFLSYFLILVSLYGIYKGVQSIEKSQRKSALVSIVKGFLFSLAAFLMCIGIVILF
jgi:hypothetical protein